MINLTKKYNHVYLNSTKTSYYIEFDNARVFYSYITPVAIWFYKDNVTYKTSTKYSVTTSKQFSVYLSKVINTPVKIVNQLEFDDLIKKVK